MHGSQLLPTLADAGFADALVAALRSESGFCVAAAAQAILAIGGTLGGGLEIIEASGAIPGLARIIKRTRWPSEPEKETGPYGRWAHDHSSRYGCLFVKLCVCVGGWGGVLGQEVK
jgi:hypothetical protein